MQTDPFLIAAYSVVAIHVMIILLDFRGALSLLLGRFSVGRLVFWQKLYVLMTFSKCLSYLALSDCPLTSLENVLRQHSASRSNYAESFVSHYLPSLSDEADLALIGLLMLSGCVCALKVAVHQTRQVRTVIRQNKCKSIQRKSNEFCYGAHNAGSIERDRYCRYYIRYRSHHCDRITDRRDG